MIQEDKMMTLKLIEKTREYLDYLEKHIRAVHKAWIKLAQECADMHFIYDDLLFHWIEREIMGHDISKLSPEEFVQYRRQFFPVNAREKNHSGFDAAWWHHKENNLHHWETWTLKPFWYPEEWVVHCVHMVVDWMAMGYVSGNTAREHYEKNKEKINLPQYAIDFVYEIFERIETG